MENIKPATGCEDCGTDDDVYQCDECHTVRCRNHWKAFNPPFNNERERFECAGCANVHFEFINQDRPDET
jgi:hypothetical protein